MKKIDKTWDLLLFHLMERIMNCFFSFIIFSRKRVNNTIIKVVCKVTLETTYNKNKIKWGFSLFFVKIIWFFVCICDQLKTLGSGKFWSKCNDSSVLMGNENYFIWLIICSSRNGEDWKGWRIWTPTPSKFFFFFFCGFRLRI